MFELIKHTENLDMATECIDEGHIYQALDIINKHVKEIIENTKPNVENALKTLNEYLDILQESIILLEQSTKASKEIAKKLTEETAQKLTEATEKLGTIEECCNIMIKSKEKLR